MDNLAVGFPRVDTAPMRELRRPPMPEPSVIIVQKRATPRRYVAASARVDLAKAHGAGANRKELQLSTSHSAPRSSTVANAVARAHAIVGTIT